MTSKNNTFPKNTSPEPQPPKLPSKIKLSNLTNQPQAIELQVLKQRVEELQIKVAIIQNRMKAKRKRIRRKSNQVDKRHKCQHCQKLYGSIVSLNLHLRLKHKNQMRPFSQHSQSSIQERNSSFSEK